jgi:hypothetical protein
MDEPSAVEVEEATELARLREENLRLRDLLIGKDAEMGMLRGQVAELQAGHARLLNLVTQVRSLLPGFVWKALGSVRRRLSRG